MSKFGLSSPSNAELVREAIATELGKIAGVGEVTADPKLWVAAMRLPALCVMLEEDDKEFSPTRSKQVTARFRILVTIQSETPENDFDDLRAAAETQIEDDPSLGGLTQVCYVSGCTRFYTSKTVAGEVYRRDILVEAEYRHDRGAP